MGDAERASGGRAGEAAAAVRRLDEITRRLRRECPWDREQDEQSIVPHTVEEAYELADAVRRGDDGRLLDELGDVLFQVHFLALLLEERGSGSLTEVAEGAAAKLIRRHPHVFEESEARELLAGDPETAREVLANWDRIKREVEGRGAGDPFADVPETLPALLYARKLQRRAASHAADRGGAADLGPVGEPDRDAVIGRIGAALGDLTVAAAGTTAGPDAEPADRDRIEAALGELLFCVVDLARRLRCDPELALRTASDRFAERVGEAGPPQPV